MAPWRMATGIRAVSRRTSYRGCRKSIRVAAGCRRLSPLRKGYRSSSYFWEEAMRLIAFCAACVVLSASGLQAADLVSGTWTAADGTATRVYVFKVSGERLTGIMCGPCDDPASVFRIEDGRI